MGVVEQASGTIRMGVDVGGSSIKWVAVDDDQIVERGRRSTPATSREDVLGVVARLVKDQAGVSAVGLALPGVIDPAGLSAVLVPNLPGEWSHQPIALPLSATLGLPVTLCNDARAFAIAEWKLGAAHGHDNVVAVTLGTGLGCGIVVDGRLIRGPGELGHVKVNDSGTPCGCGATGCLETVASASGMVRQAREAIARGESTSLVTLRDELTAKAVAAAARGGDAVAAGIVAIAGDSLGAALAALVTSLGTEIVVIGGGLSSALDILTPVIEAPIRERAAIIGDCRVVALSRCRVVALSRPRSGCTPARSEQLSGRRTHERSRSIIDGRRGALGGRL
jgi:glucokinase